MFDRLPSLTSRRFTFLLLLLAATALSPGWAQTYPSRPVTVIVPYGPGGGTDLFARALATELSTRFKVPVVVDNVPGAGGTIGVQKLTHLPNDGYTIITATGIEYEMLSLADPAAPVRKTELKALSLIGTQPVVLVARKDLGIRNMGELIAAASAKPGGLSIASVGPSTALSITSLIIQQSAGIKLLDVPYKGAGALTTDLLAGNIDLAVISLPVAVPLVREGRLLALGTSDAMRTAALPDVPALAEHPSLKNVDIKLVFAILAGKDTPAAPAQLFEKVTGDLLLDPGFQKTMTAMYLTPAKRAAAADAEALRWGQLDKFRKALGVASEK